MEANSKRIERTAATWLARRDAEGWCTRDQAQLEAWLREDDAHRVAWLRLASAWEQADRLKALGAGVPAGQVPPRGHWTLSPHFGARRERARGRARSARASRIFAFAVVACVFVAAAGAWFVWSRPEPPVQPLVYQTNVGGSTTIRLADGSEATLSSDTVIAVALSHDERDIDLRRGEAFFEVQKDASRPFVVRVDGRRVIAVGTRFAVRRDGDDGLRVVVTHGLVRLESDPDADAAATLLPAGSVAQLSGDALEIRHLSVDEARELLSWRDGFVVFHDTPLAAAAQEFNLYNTRKLVIGDSSIAGLRVGGHFRWANEDAFVRLIEQVFPVRAEKEGDRIVLLAKEPVKRKRSH
ncbi:MAG TPA: FecR domain-containing protein [Rhodanobacteraceae bacterium]|nr:FecR domain-containing protein [Rhodanobacteraceae bacterium]